MQQEQVTLAGDSAGTRRTLTLYRYGTRGAGPLVYLQAGLHADEMPGVLVLQHLMALLDMAEAEGRVSGEVAVVPVANPIGLAQWSGYKPMGRMEAESLENFNRHYPDLAALAGDALEGQLTASEDENLSIVRAAFRAALDREPSMTDLQDQRLALLKWSCAADYVLDLHCDHEAIMHLYASPARPADTSLLCRSVGAELAMIEAVSGGNAFDEANSAPWAALRQRFGDRFPIPNGCFSTTLEYRGQFDVDDVTAARDAANLMTFLAAIGALTPDGSAPAYPEPPHYPLGGALEAFAPTGGVVAWQTDPGETVTKGQVLGHVVEPVTRVRSPIVSPADGIMFRRELWRSCLRGQSLCEVSGPVVLRYGNLLSN